jgi:hypothetical protein
VSWWGKSEHLKTGAAVIAAAAAVITVVLGLAHLREANELQDEENQLRQAQFDSHLNEVMMGLDRHFVSYPALRPFFYSRQNKSFPLREPRRAQALGTAELIIDFAADVSAYMQSQKMGSRSREQWARITRSYFAESAVVRFAWQSFHGAYDESTACILGAPFQEELSRWNWRSNAPAADWPEMCV